MQQTRWKLQPLPRQEKVEKLSEELKIPELVSQILVQRDINTYDKAKKYFSPEITDLYDPFLMKDMDIAVERIFAALEENQKILVYGDYDVDGTTSVALMYSFLAKIYTNIDYYIPDRNNEGYGLSEQGVQFAIDNGFSLIITLDCGIKAIEQVDKAKSNNIDVIICDHHRPGEILPAAIAILDPLQEDCEYPFKFLSGCGVGFKLIQALAPRLGISDNEVYSYLDLVAVSIAADIVPILDENRVLATFGISVLENSPRTGLKVMLPSEKSAITISNIVFGIAPKINAAGRIEHASQSVELLIAKSELEARKTVAKIKELNSQRKTLDSSITDEALEQIITTNQVDNNSSIVYNENWHKGVIGIVASRLIDKYYKPTLVFTKGSDNMLVASARSVHNFDVYKAIEECSDLLERFGGHKYAAGLSMKEENFNEFKTKFEQAVKNNISQSQKTPEIDINLQTSLNQITDKVFRIVSRMKPFGPGNMKPVFLTKDLQFGGDSKIIGKTSEHLQFSIFEPKSQKIMKVTGFGFAKYLKQLKKQTFDLVYTLDENHWQGRVHYKLMAKDIRFHE